MAWTFIQLKVKDSVIKKDSNIEGAQKMTQENLPIYNTSEEKSGENISSIMPSVMLNYDKPYISKSKIFIDGYADINNTEKFSLTIEGKLTKEKIQAIISLLYSYETQIKEGHSETKSIEKR